MLGALISAIAAAYVESGRSVREAAARWWGRPRSSVGCSAFLFAKFGLSSALCVILGQLVGPDLFHSR